jgi:hypothetical protein
MKKIVLSLFGLALALGAAPAAHAQVNLIRLGVNSAILAKRLSKNKEAAAADGAATATPGRTVASTTDTYEGKTFPMVRTPADQLPKKGAEQVVAMETELDRCHAALLASPTGPVCTPEQRTAIQTAVVNLARAQSNKNLAAYQQEATFYLNEDAHRQQAAAAPAPAK